MSIAVERNRVHLHHTPHARKNSTYEIGIHPVNARLYHVTLAQERLSEFFAAVTHIDTQNLQYVPFARFAVAKKFSDLFGERFATTVRSILTDRDSGGFTIGVQGTTSSADDTSNSALHLRI